LIERELPNLNDTSKNIIMELSQSITWMNIEEISIKIWISERTIRDYVNKLIKLWIVKRHSEHIRDKNALYSL
jgi:DNA-binding Lrp family transcriptional regulator